MPPLAGMVDLREDPSIDLQLASSIGQGIGSVITNYRLQQEQKRKTALAKAFIGVLSNSMKNGYSGQQTLDEISKVPGIADSELYQEWVMQQQLNQQKAAMEQQKFQQQQQLQSMKDNAALDRTMLTTDNQYNIAAMGNNTRLNIADAGNQNRLDVANLNAQTRIDTNNANIQSRENIAAENRQTQTDIANNRMATQMDIASLNSQRPTWKPVFTQDGQMVGYQDMTTGQMQPIQGGNIGNQPHRTPGQISQENVTTELRSASSELSRLMGYAGGPTQEEIANLDLRLNRIGYRVEQVSPFVDRQWPIPNEPASYRIVPLQNTQQAAPQSTQNQPVQQVGTQGVQQQASQPEITTSEFQGQKYSKGQTIYANGKYFTIVGFAEDGEPLVEEGRNAY